MKIIEIKTTQNVVLQYELAELRDRIVSFIIDFAIVVFSLGIISVIVNSVVYNSTALEIFNTILICIFIFYSLAFEVLNNGQSLGKMAMRIQVIKSTSGKPRFADYAGRWVFRLVDIYFSLGGLASVMIASSSKAQRIGDIVANTAVVKLTPRINLSLDDILSMHAPTNYKPEYTQAKQLAEEDAILIKNTLDRLRKFGNDAHVQAAKMLARELASILKIDQDPPDTQKFLEAVLRDYVMLTR